MTMDDWRRKLLRLMQAERIARDRVNQRLGPHEAELAYREFQAAELDLNRHYAVRPLYYA